MGNKYPDHEIVCSEFQGHLLYHLLRSDPSAYLYLFLWETFGLHPRRSVAKCSEAKQVPHTFFAQTSSFLWRASSRLCAYLCGEIGCYHHQYEIREGGVATTLDRIPPVASSKGLDEVLNPSIIRLVCTWRWVLFYRG
jgi:hypothetical protein